ncbi:MAG: glycosyltransferase family 4 protein [Rikenellaceae bacterium]
MRNKTFVLVSPKNRTAYNFRGELIEEIVTQGYKVYVTGPNRIDVDKIEALGAEFVEIANDKNGVSITSDIKYLLALIKLFRRVKPSVTLGYTVKPVIYGAIAARLSGVKSINSMITGVGYLFISKSRKAKLLKSLVLILYKIGLWCADNVIFQNRDDRSEFVANGLVKDSKCNLVNGSGVNMSRFTRAPYPEQLTFFMLSRAMYSKGVMEYAEAARMVKSKYSDIRFIFLGAFENIQDSVDEAEFRAKYIDSGVFDYFPETDNVPSFIAMSSVYVLPSYREGTPRTVLEAMAMGRAIITTDVPGCRETVQNTKNGFLVDVRSAQAVADAMIHIIENPALIQEMGDASYDYCHTKYRVEVVNETMRTILKI